MAKSRSGGRHAAARAKVAARSQPAKKKPVSFDFKRDDPDGLRDNLINFIQARYEGHGRMVTARDAPKLVVGLPLPSLSLCCLFEMNCLPLGRMIEIVGPPASCKTALLYEFYRLILSCGGDIAHIENENKEAPVLLNSIMRWNDAYLRRITEAFANSVEEWQTGITNVVVSLVAAFEGVAKAAIVAEKMGTALRDEDYEELKQRPSKAPGWIMPFGIGLDSLVATTNAKEIAKMQTAGAASVGFAVDANLISRYFKMLPSMLRHRPIVLFATNHLKEKYDQYGHAQEHSPGGHSPKFMESMRLNTRRLGRQIREYDFGGANIVLSIAKQSLSREGTNVLVKFLWTWRRHQDGHIYQHSYWDWSEATVQFLLQLQETAPKAWQDVKEIVDIRRISVRGKPGQHAWSKKLGVPEEAPVLFTQLGAMIDNDPEILEQLYDVLHIERYKFMQQGADYLETQRRALAEIDAASARPVTSHPLSRLAPYSAKLDEELKRTKAKTKGQQSQPAAAPAPDPAAERRDYFRFCNQLYEEG